MVGPECECSPQTVVHRLNVLSQVYKFWVLHRDNAVINPVVEGVRPSLDNRRERRLLDGEEERLLKVLERSSRPWLRAAAIISIETAMRQAELAAITHGRLHLNEARTHLSLGKDAPISRPIERFGRVIAEPLVGGPHHRYARI